MRRSPEQVVRLLSQAPAHPVLRNLIQELYRDWTVRTAREFLHLPTGAREAAFAVALEQLAREARTEKLVSSDFPKRSRDLVLSALLRQRKLNERRTPSERSRAWMPVEVGDAPATPEQLVDLVWRAALHERSPAVDDAVAAFRDRWMRRAAHGFSKLNREEREEAVDDAVVRLISPLTAACLTPDNLARRCRAVAVNALTNANDRMDRKARVEKLSEASDGGVDDERPEDLVERRYHERLEEEIAGARDRALPWMKSAPGTKTMKDVAREEGRTHAAIRKQASRANRFIEAVTALLKRTGYSKKTSEEIKTAIDEAYRQYRPKRELARQVAAAVQRVIESDLARSLLPAAILNSLLRVARWLRDPSGNAGEEGPPDQQSRAS